jgi:TPR repeat protein
MLKVGSGLFAGIVAGGLGYGFWPSVEPGVLASRPAVEKPVFVVASTAAARPAPAPTIAVATQQPAPASTILVAAQQPAPTPQFAVAAASESDKASIDKLAAALKTHGVAGPATRGIASIAPQGPAPSEEASAFCARGLVALADGDIANARLFLRRAADAGDPRALMALGDTFDAATLTRLGVVGTHGDATQAHDYYARALAAGVGAARERIAALESRGN